MFSSLQIVKTSNKKSANIEGYVFKYSLTFTTV